MASENHCFSDYEPIDGAPQDRLITMPGYGKEHIVIDGKVFVKVEDYNKLFKTSKKYTWSEKDKKLLLDALNVNGATK